VQCDWQWNRHCRVSPHIGSHLWGPVALETLWWCIGIHLIVVIYNRRKLWWLLSHNFNKTQESGNKWSKRDTYAHVFISTFYNSVVFKVVIYKCYTHTNIETHIIYYTHIISALGLHGLFSVCTPMEHHVHPMEQHAHPHGATCAPHGAPCAPPWSNMRTPMEHHAHPTLETMLYSRGSQTFINVAPLSTRVNSNKHFWHKAQLMNNILF
jgi:hypothetical protein